MKCQSCSSVATVHLTDIVQGTKREVHLCQECAEQQHLVTKHELDLPAILQNLIGCLRKNNPGSFDVPEVH